MRLAGRVSVELAVGSPRLVVGGFVGLVIVDEFADWGPPNGSKLVNSDIKPDSCGGSGSNEASSVGSGAKGRRGAVLSIIVWDGSVGSVVGEGVIEVENTFDISVDERLVIKGGESWEVYACLDCAFASLVQLTLWCKQEKKCLVCTIVSLRKLVEH